MFDREDPGKPPILSHGKSTHWGVNLMFLGWQINAHADRFSLPDEKTERLRDLLDEWSPSRQTVPAKEVPNLTGKLWNVKFAFPAGKYRVWQMLRLIGLHNRPARDRIVYVRVGRAFHDGINWWKWTIRETLLS